MNVSIRRQNHDQQQQYSIYSPTAINLLYDVLYDVLMACFEQLKMQERTMADKENCRDENARKDNDRQKCRT